VLSRCCPCFSAFLILSKLAPVMSRRKPIFAYPFPMKCFLGIDGGGTKTEWVVLNECGAIVARGTGPASNPTRIGFPAAFAALNETCNAAINSTRIPFEVVALCAGLAGTGRPENREQMLQFLSQRFSNAHVDVRTDLELPLYAMPPGPAMVLVAGTGSAAIGRDSQGTVKREGGLGPGHSDEGSAFDIGQAAVSVARTPQEPSHAQHDELARQIFEHLNCSNWAELDLKSAANPDSVYPRIFPVVAAAADSGSDLARSLLQSATQKLAAICQRLSESLNLAQQSFPLGKTGGTIGRSRFFDQALDQALLHKLPQAIVSRLSVEPAELAAWIALQSAESKQGIAS